VLEPAEALHLRARYVRSNLRDNAGSMTYAARSAARDPGSPLRPETRAAILAPRASKHSLPVEVRRAMRAAPAVVSMYRHPERARLDGAHAVSCLRMVREADGTLRRLRPGERQSWDDASINFCCVVPWPWGGDRCSDRWGVRVGRFQLLAGIDDATDFCPGFSYVIRMRDSYRAEDVVAAMFRTWRSAYMPERVVLEGGAWQSERAMAFIRESGAGWESARGRPHSKLIEGFWHRLWTPLSERSCGQIGRYRGEMEREKDLWMRAQAGSLDPRRAFPALAEALDAIEWSIGYVNQERVESREYGAWVPAEAHAAGLAAVPRPAVRPDIAWLAWPERHTRTVRRGMLVASALSPLGHVRRYCFAGEALLPFEGAPVTLSFDPWANPVVAAVQLASHWQEHRQGLTIATDLESVGADPHVLRDESAWTVAFGDGVAAVQRARRQAAATVRREHVTLGLAGPRVSELRAPERQVAAVAIGTDALTQQAISPPEIDLAALEAEEARVSVA
jgi:hypothetical protein